MSKLTSWKTIFLLCIFCLATAIGSPAQIANASFETPALTCTPGPACFLENTFSGWIYSAGATATFRPSVGAGQEFTSLPDGHQVAAIANGFSEGEIYQDLSATVAANTTYTLTFWVGHRTDFPFDPGYVVSLKAGGVTLATGSGASPAPGTFVKQTVVYNSGPSPAELGKTFRIDIFAPAGSGQADFDLFALSASTTFNVSGAGTSTGQGTFATGINKGGAIQGFYVDKSNVLHGFVRSSTGTINTFSVTGAGTAAGQGTLPEGLNSGGAITGPYIDAKNVFHGFLRSSTGTITKFNVSGGGTGAGQGTLPDNINLSGEIAGYYVDSAGVDHGFVRSSTGSIIAFDAPGAGTGKGQGTVTAPFDGLNDNGYIAGDYIDASGVAHGYIRAPGGAFTTFSVLGAGTASGQGTFASGINLAGTFVGLYIDAKGVNHGFVRSSGGTITKFNVTGAGTGKGQGTLAQNINSTGVVVGYYIDSAGAAHGFERSATGVITKFNAPGAGTAAMQGTFAISNNSSGVITGYYVDKNGVAHGFLAK